MQELKLPQGAAPYASSIHPRSLTTGIHHLRDGKLPEAGGADQIVPAHTCARKHSLTPFMPHESCDLVFAYSINSAAGAVLMPVVPCCACCAMLCCVSCCRYRALNVQAGTQFCDGGFEGEVAAGRISSTSLDKYSCVALAGERGVTSEV